MYLMNTKRKLKHYINLKNRYMLNYMCRSRFSSSINEMYQKTNTHIHSIH